MRVLRDREEELETSGWLPRLARLAERDPLALLVELGMLEQAVLDRRAEDGLDAVERALGRAMIEAAHACLGAPARALEASPLVHAIAHALPARCVARTPEGFLHYALDPLAYAASARRYAREVGHGAAGSAMVVGIRSIGTTLSAIVAAAIGARSRTTLRPRGPSGARAIRARPELEAAVREHEGDVLIVDEGPGVTGETFERVARWLIALGIDVERIRLFPSHARSPELACDARRAFLAGLRSYPPDDRDERPERIARTLGLRLGDELTGGRWREHARVIAPTRGIFERRKIRAFGERSLVLRWNGLGPCGEQALALASRLAEAGLGVQPIEAREGFVLAPWIEGRARSRGAPRTRAFLDAVARYLRVRQSRCGTGRGVDTSPLGSLLDENAREVGLDPTPALRLLEALPPREAVLVDARLAPWEWVETGDSFVKVDAIDHGDGVHLPGPTDAAWDVAGAWIEHELDQPIVEAMMGTDRHTIPAARALLAPYAALALGDAMLCARAAPPEEQALFAREIAFYRSALERALGIAHACAREPIASLPSG